MKKYITEYKVDNEKYSSHIYSKSFKEAEKIAEKRNIGEKVMGISSGTKDGYGRIIPEELKNPDFRNLSDYDFIKQLPDIIHTACFLGFISSHGNNPIDVLSDEGVLHNLIHLMVCSETNTRMIRRVRGDFYELQNSIQGYLKI